MANNFSDHDASYKQLFSCPEIIRGLLEDFVGEDWISQLDLTTLEPYPGHFVSDDLKHRQSDLIWRVKHKEYGWCYVYILLEFQSQVDQWMAVRIMVYVGLLYQDLIKREVVATGDRLPPVFPIVIYNGERRWNAPQDVSELIHRLSPTFDVYIPRHRFFLVDESAILKEELESKGSLTALIMQLEKAGTPYELRDLIKRLIERCRDPEYTSLRRAFVAWINRVLGRRFLREPLPEIHNLTEVEAMLAERVRKWEQQWLQEGIQKGLQQGLQQGIQQGLQQGMLYGRRSLLEELLIKRFGPLTSQWKNRLENASLEEVNRWTERILDAKTIDEVFN